MFGEIRWAVGHVLLDRRRRQFLFADGPRTLRYTTRFLRRIVPNAAARLALIRERAQSIPDAELRAQALASIHDKAYHVAGAAVLATFLPGAVAERYLDAVVPLESIYDYLDNVCDRHSQRDPAFFRSLHQAISDALSASPWVHSYYIDGPPGDDGGYLEMLVRDSKAAIGAIDPDHRTLADFSLAAKLYADMQTFTHLSPERREGEAFQWYDENRALAPALDWHEFAAACGSQFQIYGPLFEAAAMRGAAATAAFRAHFPWVAALHVLLDSFIDRDEDAAHGDLNLVRVYGSARRFRERAVWLCAQANTAFEALPDPYPHRFALRLMLLFYLTHPKVYRQHLNEQATELLEACGRHIT